MPDVAVGAKLLRSILCLYIVASPLEEPDNAFHLAVQQLGKTKT